MQVVECLLKTLPFFQEECFKFKETRPSYGGTDVLYAIGKNQFGLGGYYRLGDAAIASFKYISDFIDVGVSYDFNTSNINNTSSSNGNSFEIFVDYKIKQEIKYKQYEILIELFDKDTKEPLEGDCSFKN